MKNWAFLYHTEVDVEELRESLIDLIFQCLESQTPVTKAEFDKKIPALIYGTYATRAGESVKSSLDELHWKYSEITGKYCGCQFWSASAKRLFEKALLIDMNGITPTLKDARRVASRLSSKVNKRDQLVHEHVFPRVALRKLLDREIPADMLSLAETIERLAVGCIVLEGEHSLIGSTKGDSINPWRRYTEKITLCENQDWPISHLRLIRDAGLLDRGRP